MPLVHMTLTAVVQVALGASVGLVMLMSKAVLRPQAASN